MPKNGGAGMVSAFGPAYPKHDLKVWELLENGKYEEADALKNSFAEAVGPALAKISGIKPTHGTEMRIQMFFWS